MGDYDDTYGMWGAEERCLDQIDGDPDGDYVPEWALRYPSPSPPRLDDREWTVILTDPELRTVIEVMQDWLNQGKPPEERMPTVAELCAHLEQLHLTPRERQPRRERPVYPPDPGDPERGHR